MSADGEHSTTGDRAAAASLVALALCLCSAAWAPPPDKGPTSRAPHGSADGGAAAAGPDSLLPELEYLNNGTSRLLYLYLRGLALHERGRWALSNQALAEADALLEDLYTRHVIREAGALLISDNVVEYRGERFESAYLHYYKILNYLGLGEMEGAAVECRRLNHKLQRFADDPQRPFADDPFLQYLTAMVYEAAGERTDAEVSLRNAEAGFDRIGGSLGVVAPACMGHDPAAAWTAGADSTVGRVRLFIEIETVPRRREASLTAPIFREEITEDLDESRYAADLTGRLGRPVDSHLELEYLLRVAVPTLVESGSRIASARVLATPTGGGRALAIPADQVADLSARARAAFEERKNGIWVRAVGRALAKYLATRKARKEGGKVAGGLVNLAAVVTENADTRSWSTLPDRIHLAGADLPAGDYRLDVVLMGPHGERRGFVRIPDVTVRAGRTTFRSCRVR